MSKKVNKNNYITTCRASHPCKKCKKTINPGQKARTINPKKVGLSRFWICMDCEKAMKQKYKEKIDLMNSIFQIKLERDNVAFGDDGAWFAFDDYMNEKIEELGENCSEEELYEFLEELEKN